MFECMHCLQKAVIRDADFNPDKCGYEGEGVVHYCHCTNCGAEIEYVIIDKEEDEEDHPVSEE